MSINKYLKSQAKLIDQALDRFLPQAKEPPALIHEAMRYGALGVGKRIRPILTLAVSDLFKGSRPKAMIPACAIEMVHSYSLIHDDLPPMDNDDFRRGRVTCHKKYGEGYAILAGDALLTEAFSLLSKYPDAKKTKRLVEILSSAAGSRGMVGGQAAEMIFENQELDKATLDFVHINKTGKLLVAACLSGAVSAGASKRDEKRILRYAECIGFAFQIVDDIMDGDGYLKIMSPSEARKEVSCLTQKAQSALKPFGRKAKILIEIAEFLGKREK
jgi:geranylgeranyl diphosphate synthase type II